MYKKGKKCLPMAQAGKFTGQGLYNKYDEDIKEQGNSNIVGAAGAAVGNMWANPSTTPANQNMMEQRNTFGDVNWKHVLGSTMATGMAQGISNMLPNSYQNAVLRHNQQMFNPTNYLPYTANNSLQDLYGMQEGGQVFDDMEDFMWEDEPSQEEAAPVKKRVVQQEEPTSSDEEEFRILNDRRNKRNSYINETGYLDDEETSSNPFNIIPGGEITMNGVSRNISARPVKGGNIGDEFTMFPGAEYEFDADYTIETPQYQKGGTYADSLAAYQLGERIKQGVAKNTINSVYDVDQMINPNGMLQMNTNGKYRGVAPVKYKTVDDPDRSGYGIPIPIYKKPVGTASISREQYAKMGFNMAGKKEVQNALDKMTEISKLSIAEQNKPERIKEGKDIEAIFDKYGVPKKITGKNSYQYDFVALENELSKRPAPKQVSTEDPRMKAYNDSLSLYNKGKKMVEEYWSSPMTDKEYAEYVERGNFTGDPVKDTIKRKDMSNDKIKPINFVSKADFPVYKKPTKPAPVQDVPMYGTPKQRATHMDMPEQPNMTAPKGSPVRQEKTGYSMQLRNEDGTTQDVYFNNLDQWKSFTEANGYQDRNESSDGKSAHAVGYKKEEGGIVEMHLGGSRHGKMSKNMARKILRDGELDGRELTKRQQHYFKHIAAGDLNFKKGKPEMNYQKGGGIPQIDPNLLKRVNSNDIAIQSGAQQAINNAGLKKDLHDDEIIAMLSSNKASVSKRGYRSEMDEKKSRAMMKAAWEGSHYVNDRGEPIEPRFLTKLQENKSFAAVDKVVGELGEMGMYLDGAMGAGKLLKGAGRYLSKVPYQARPSLSVAKDFHVADGILPNNPAYPGDYHMVAVEGQKVRPGQTYMVDPADYNGMSYSQAVKAGMNDAGNVIGPHINENKMNKGDVEKFLDALKSNDKIDTPNSNDFAELDFTKLRRPKGDILDPTQIRAQKHMKDLAIYGEQPKLDAGNFLSNKEIHQIALHNELAQKHFVALDKSIPDNLRMDMAERKAFEELQKHPELDMDAFITGQVKMGANKGENLFELPEYPKAGIRRSAMNGSLGSWQLPHNVMPHGDKVGISNFSGLREEMLNVRPTINSKTNWNSKAMKSYRDQLPRYLQDLQLEDFTGKKAFKDLKPNKRGGKVHETYRHGGFVEKSYIEGDEIELSDDEIQALINQGYKIEFL